MTHDESKRNNNNIQNPLVDDYLFSPSSTTIKPKPRLSLQTKTADHHQTDDIPNPTTINHESTVPLNLNTTVRKPMVDLHNVDWLTDSQPAKPTTEKNPLYHLEEEEAVHNDNDRRSSSPQRNNGSGVDTYGSNDFEDNYDETDNSEQ
jgi:hypothetical protein